jgi:hypothetical protein
MPKRTTVVLVGLLVAPVAAHAQAIHGVLVEDDTGEAITGAHVELVASDGHTVASTRTGGDGAFLLRLRRAGAFTVRLTHLGYTSVESDTVVVDPHETLSVELRMARAAIPLEPLVVLARADARRAGGFYERMQRPGAVGHFVTRERLERRRGVWITNIVGEVPGVYLRQVFCHGSPCGHLITMRGMGVGPVRTPPHQDEPDASPGVALTASDQCAPTIYVDGLRMEEGETVDAFLRPDNLEGVEIYTRGSSAPYPLLARDACGVVAFWTREDGLSRFTWKKLGAWVGGIAVVFALAGR